MQLLLASLKATVGATLIICAGLPYEEMQLIGSSLLTPCQSPVWCTLQSGTMCVPRHSSSKPLSSHCTNINIGSIQLVYKVIECFAHLLVSTGLWLREG